MLTSKVQTLLIALIPICARLILAWHVFVFVGFFNLEIYKDDIQFIRRAHLLFCNSRKRDMDVV